MSSDYIIREDANGNQNVYRTADNFLVPQVSGDPDFEAYILWLLVPNTPPFISWVQQEIDALTVQVNSLISSNTTLTNDIASLTSSIATNSANISSLSSTVSGLAATVSALNTTVSGINTNISGKLDVSAKATASDVKTGSDNTKYVTSSVMKAHKGVDKAWVSFNVDGTINASYNVASVVKNTTGSWTITYTTAFGSAEYAANVSYEFGLTAALFGMGIKKSTQAAGSIQIQAITVLGVLADPAGKIYFSAFGDQ